MSVLGPVFGVSATWFSTKPFLGSFAQHSSQRAPFVIGTLTGLQAARAAPLAMVKRIAAANAITHVWLILLIVICPE
jgi:hypothetical protein